MTTPSEQEAQALDKLTTALIYAQSIGVVHDALAAFPDVVEGAVKALLEMPPIRGLITLNREKSGPHAAEVAMRRQNLLRRAAYLVSAARRLTTAFRYDPNMARALEQERTYLAAHLEANTKRTLAAKQVAKLAQHRAYQGLDWDRETGGMLGWYATLDARTSLECRRANGRNFDPTRIPRIGFPGAVHPNCRCKAGPPHRSGDRVEDLPVPTAVEIAASRGDVGSWTISGGTV